MAQTVIGSIFLGNTNDNTQIIIRLAKVSGGSNGNRTALRTNVYGKHKSELTLVDVNDGLYSTLKSLMEEQTKNGFVSSIDTIKPYVKWYRGTVSTTAPTTTANTTTANPTTSGSKTRSPLFTINIDKVETINKVVKLTKEQYKKTISEIRSKLVKFFSEFEYIPSARFCDTLFRANDKKAYALNTFRVANNPYAESVKEKLESVEFSTILSNIEKLDFANHCPTAINNRLHIFFGDKGGGKSTEMRKLVGEDRVFACGPSTTDDDLVRTFDFKDGKATFVESAIIKACEGGYPIGLDEINKLPFDTLGLMQTITDNGKEVEYKTIHFHINDGFKIYGTMNLSVNGIVLPLPEPLIDRAVELTEFLPTDDEVAEWLTESFIE